MTAAHVFISYARRDGAGFAGRLEQALPDQGFATWRDTRGIDPSQDFTAEIEKAIEDALCVVACVTPDVRRADSFVRREIGYAQAIRKPILVARFADVVPPIAVVNHTWLDFFSDWPGAQARLLTFLRTGLPEPSRLPATPAGDPFRAYLEALYRQIVRFLDKTVVAAEGADAPATVLPLSAAASPEAVAAPAPALPRAFFAAAGVENDAETGADAPLYATLHEAFESHQGRLLLLGAPGSGKTTALMAFAREAVSRRLEDPTLPLPILAPIATWDAGARPPLATWLADLIPALSTGLGAVLETSQALLMLDGLDELGERVKGGAGDARGPDPRVLFLDQLPANNRVLLTCRAQEYQALGHKARLAGAVTLRPLDDTQIRSYLGRAPELRACVDRVPDLREALRLPLLLSLFTRAFQGERTELGSMDTLAAGAVRDAIFERFIRQRYEHERRKPNASVPFALDELLGLLGSMVARVEAFMPGGGWWDRPGFLTHAHMAERFGETRGAALAEFLTRLNLLVPQDESRLRFLHGLLSDHLAFRQAMMLATAAHRRPRTAAMVILRALRDPRSIPVLLTALADPAEQVRWNATAALAELADPRAIPGLIRMLGDRSQPCWLDAYDQTPPAYAIAADGLARLGAAAVAPLIAQLDAAGAQVRGAAAEILGRIGDPEAIPALEAFAAKSKPSETAEIGWSTESLTAIADQALQRIRSGARA